MSLSYCSRCVLPDSRPNLTIEADGVCNACHAHDSRPEIDWAARERAFWGLVETVKARHAPYDCLVPVSGGKDSHWQVLTCLERGLKPLAFTWRTPGRTDLGDANLKNLVSLGVEHLEFQVNPEVERRFMRLALETRGSSAVPMHMAIFNLSLRFAVQFGIPLVVWGENSAFEYGGTEDERRGFFLDSRWIERFGVTHGTVAKDWVSEDLSEQELRCYEGPSDEAIRDAGVKSIFLGYYFPWDPTTTFEAARSHGFKPREEGPKTGLYAFADIDDHFISVHHHFKWYKFGFTRLFDNLSLEIRNGRITREGAVRIIREAGPEDVEEDIDRLCQFLRIDRGRFQEIVESFRNPEVWSQVDGTWRIPGFLIADWDWCAGGGTR